MPVTAARAVLRPSRLLLRRAPMRNASTATEAANNAVAGATKAKDVATSKASEGLSRVTSSANSALSKTASAASNALGGVGGRAGRLIKFVESIIPPTVYYSRVGLELGKIVFKNQKMAPPSTAQVQSYYQRLVQLIRNPSSLSAHAPSALTNPQEVLGSIRNINSKQLATVGVIAAETLGFFTVGEMIGRMKIVGYRGKVEHH